ncbi:MAG: hypothetical protein CVT73_09990 [Alphaproteobacteria bacterium HGW-Alphaproteobacteria-12]|nr:MAG: hypothetical protein CVT73_09990 [Alphaproteobacteria bacterium HGW-Alphaproteobacteria-12]
MNKQGPAAQTLIIRADGGPVTGAGHLMRTLAIAESWKRRGGEVFYLSAETTSSFHDNLEQRGMKFMAIAADIGSDADARETIALAEKHEAEWIIVDGYSFAPVWRAALAGAGLKVLLIDDLAQAGPYRDNIVLNPNPRAAALDYRFEREDPVFLFGLDYALIRDEIRNARVDAAPGPEPQGPTPRILVTLGGSEIVSKTYLHVAAALAAAKGEAVELTFACPDKPGLRKNIAAVLAGSRCEVRFPARNASWGRELARAGFIVTGCGGSVFEILFLRKHFAAIALADNQRLVADYLAASRFARCFEAAALAADEETRALLAAETQTASSTVEPGPDVIDGKGPERIIEAMLEFPSGGN